MTVTNPRPPKVNVEHNLIEFVFPGFDLFRPFAETLLARSLTLSFGVEGVHVVERV